MPKIDPAAAPFREGTDYPAPYDEPIRARRRWRLGEVAGLTAFGVNRLELDPGVWSSQRHTHSLEDEFVIVLQGEVVLVEDDGETVLRAGDCAAFKAGAGVAHHLINRSDRTAEERLGRVASAADSHLVPGHEVGVRLVGEDDHGAGLRHRELLPGDVLDGAAEDVDVIEADVREQHDARPEHIRRVVAASEPRLHDRDVDVRLRERGERGGGDDLELRRVQLLAPAPDTTATAKPSRPPRPGHGPRSQPTLPVVAIRHELPPDQRACPACGGELTEMAGQTEDSERITTVKLTYQVEQHRRQKYRCACNSAVVTAPGVSAGDKSL